MAIARDATSTSNGTGAGPYSSSHTCTGDDLILYVIVRTVDDAGAGSSDAITGVTYNSVAMTELGKVSVTGTPSPENGTIYHYALLAPSTGANTLEITSSASLDSVVWIIHSYTGVTQAALPSNFNTNNENAPGGGTHDISETTTGFDAWLVGGVDSDNGIITISGDVTEQVAAGGNLKSFDTNGVVSGTKTASFSTVGTTEQWFSCIAEINAVPPKPRVMFF